MRHLLLYLFILACVSAHAQNTTRKNLKLDKEVFAMENADTDTIHFPPSDSISLSGYEKAHSSTKETFFVTNHSDRYVEKICVTLTYTDMHGSILHKRDLNLDLDLPAGETRHIAYKFWDPHKLWYYKGTQSKHNAYSSPFDVSYKIVYAIRHVASPK